MAGLVFLSLSQVGILAARGIEVNDFWKVHKNLGHTLGLNLRLKRRCDAMIAIVSENQPSDYFCRGLGTGA